MSNYIPVIRQFVVERLAENGNESNLQNDDSLIETGVLDSLNFLKLVAFLDEKFGITLKDDDLDPKKMDSIILINDLIQENQASEKNV